MRFQLTKAETLHATCREALGAIAKQDGQLPGHKTVVDRDQATITFGGLTIRVSFHTVNEDRASLSFALLLTDADGKHSYHWLAGIYADKHGMLYNEAENKTADHMETVQDTGDWYVSLLSGFYKGALKLKRVADWLTRDDQMFSVDD